MTLHLGNTAAEPLELLVGADDAYAMPLAVTLYSALEHLSPGCRINVYIIDGGISSTNRERIERVLKAPSVKLQLTWISPELSVLNELPRGLGSWDYLSKAMYFRLFAPDLISAARVIYLDSDIVVQKNLEELWSLDLTSHAAAAVTEIGTTLPGGNTRYREAWKLQGLDLDKPHFNSGVLLINLALWRKNHVSSAVFANIRAHREMYVYPDQDGLNAVLHDRWLELDNKWNFQVTYKELEHKPVPAAEVNIFHYSTRAKPWLELASRGKEAYFAPFLQTLERSKWFSAAEYLRFRARLALAFTAAIPLKTFHRLIPKTSSR